jgi:hypothetical protein
MLHTGKSIIIKTVEKKRAISVTVIKERRKAENGWGNIRKGPKGRRSKILCNDIFILMAQARSALQLVGSVTSKF